MTVLSTTVETLNVDAAMPILMFYHFGGLSFFLFFFFLRT